MAVPSLTDLRRRARATLSRGRATLSQGRPGRSGPAPDTRRRGSPAVLLLVNPTAGRGRAGRLEPSVVDALRQQGYSPAVVVTGSLAEATQCARRAAEGTIVAALGGDGFLGAVAAGARVSGAVVLPLAGGRGNDTVRRLGLPLDPVRTVRAIRELSIRPIDVGLVNGRPFLGVAHAGFDALANEYGNAARFPLGPFVYLYGGIRAFRAWRDVTLTVGVDGQERSSTGWFAAVGGVGQYGGGLRICPNAEIDDALLDVVSLGKSSIANVVVVFLLSYRGRHLGRPGVTSRRGRVISISADRELNAYADGELVGPLPMTVTVDPSALHVLLPGDRPRNAAPLRRRR